MHYARYVTRAASVLASLALLGMASIAVAEETLAVKGTEPSSQAMVVQIGPGGNALLRGTVGSVGPNTLTVKSWGGNWTVSIGSSTTVTPHEDAANDLSDIKTGDFVGVQGTANSSAAWTIDAKLVRDWTSRKTAQQETKTNLQAVRSTEKTGRENGVGKVFEGTASNITATSLTLTTTAGTAYTVNVSSTTKLVDKKFHTLSALTLVQAGDHTRVFGTASDTTITAQVVRDTSLPH